MLLFVIGGLPSLYYSFFCKLFFVGKSKILLPTCWSVCLPPGGGRGGNSLYGEWSINTIFEGGVFPHSIVVIYYKSSDRKDCNSIIYIY